MAELKDPKSAGPVPQPELINATVEVVEDTSNDSGYIVPNRNATNPYVVEGGSALTSGAWGVQTGFVQGHTVGGNYKPSDETADDEELNTRTLTVSEADELQSKGSKSSK